jgi:hypothetical protein
MKYLIIEQSVVSNYLHGDSHGDPNLVCTDIYSLYNVSCIRISDMLYSSLRPLWRGKAIEISEETAVMGSALFSEIRPQGKVAEAAEDHYALVKKPVDMTPEVCAIVLDFMSKFAKMIIEAEFDRRYHEMVDTSKFELASWDVQKHEAQEFLNDKNAFTPFLDYLVVERELDKTQLATKILAKSEEYYDKLSTELAKLQKLIKEFEKAPTIWDMNILYENYFGVMMPTSQAVQMGLTVSPEDENRRESVKIHEFGF